MDERTLLTASAYDIAAWIRAGSVTSREAVDAHIAQVERVNPRLNAVVATRFDEARAEADAADALLASGGDVPELHGVPCTIKETFALTGMPNSAGMVSRAGIPATADAPTVARWRAAGAIPLGVTNVSELAMWMESHNKVYGRSNNPYDVTRLVGGSSGGEGASVGAGFAPFGLGSDIGGSIRMPAYFNGVFGHKPSAALVPNTGQYPVAKGLALRYQCTGPLTRKATDLMPLLRLLAGPVPGDTIDTECVGGELGDPRSVDIAGLEVLLVRGDGRFRVDREVAGAQWRAAEELRRAGAVVREVELADLRHAFDIWGAMLKEANDSFRSQLTEGAPFHGGRELWRFVTGRSPHTLPALGLALVERYPEMMPARAQRFIDLGHQLRAQVQRMLPHGTVLLYPPYPDVVPRHNRPLLLPLKWVYTAVWNVMEIPVTAVPLGLSGQGLPLGVQVGARHGDDHVTIAVAEFLEERLGGWVPPPGVFA